MNPRMLHDAKFKMLVLSLAGLIRDNHFTAFDIREALQEVPNYLANSNFSEPETPTIYQSDDERYIPRIMK